MDVKKDQDHFDLSDDFTNTKTEPETGTSQTNQNKCTIKRGTFKNEHGDVLGDKTFSDFEYQTSEQFPHIDAIKNEIIECEMSKIERLDLPIKLEQDTVSENVQRFPKTIKQELENTSDVTVTYIKQEVDEYIIQPKTESVVSELLNSDYDLSTLKTESTDCPDNYLVPAYSHKPLESTSQVILKKRRRYACPICQKNLPSSISRWSHVDRHFKKRYIICQFCGRSMKKIDFFHHFFIHVVKNRMKNHIDDKPWKYNISSKMLKRKNVDNGVKKSFECGTCLKTFNLKYKLRKHLIIHSGEKPFKCDICSKDFNKIWNLKQHLIIHSGEKPFKCHICSKSFNLKSYLQKHLKIHSAEKPFNCDICSKGFTTISNFQQHSIIHSREKSFKCNICSKSFNLKSYLQKHLIIHKGGKPFKCDICSKGFILNSNLQSHLIIHSSENPFNCDICSKWFNRKSSLNRHLKTHRNKNVM